MFVVERSSCGKSLLSICLHVMWSFVVADKLGDRVGCPKLNYFPNPKLGRVWIQINDTCHCCVRCVVSSTKVGLGCSSSSNL